MDNDTVARALALCHSGRLIYVNATTVAVRREHTLEEDSAEETIDFSERYLPPSRLRAQGAALSDDADLTIATILAIDSQLASVGANKATHKTVVSNVRVLSKLWEWGRLYGLYAVADWKPGHMRLLERQLSKGRWGEALQIKARTKTLLATRPSVNLIVRDAESEAPIVRAGLARLIQSNVTGHELGCVREIVFRYAGIKASPVETNEPDPEEGGEESAGRPTVSWFLQTMRIINELARIEAPYAFAFTPFNDTHATAAKYAKPSKRTATMPINHAVGLLVNSFSWVYEKADAVIAAVDTLARVAPRLEKARSEKDRSQVLNDYWARSSVRKFVEGKLGGPVSLMARGNGDDEKHYLPILISKVMAGCFIVIAGMNARRKDEIIHPSFGLRRDSVRPINAALGVYEGTFYIEKTLKSYAPYYVNQATHDAHAVLVRLEAAHLRLEKAISARRRDKSKQKHSLFWTARVTVNKGTLTARTWWDFNLKNGTAAEQFLTEAFGAETDVAVTAHMFRRFYAIIFYYRFDHGGLLHLRYQLAHLDVGMTLQYVSDAFLMLMIDRIPVELRREPDAVRAALQSEWAGFQRELATVESEKTSGLLADLLKGGRATGGFPKLVERLHRMLSRDVDYSKLDIEAQAKYLRERITKRGHALTPMLNTNCMVGESHGRAAKCANATAPGPAQENASAATCAKCAYSWGGETHVAGQRLDLEQLEDEVARSDPSTIQAQALIRRVKNLKRVIVLHEERLLQTAAG